MTLTAAPPAPAPDESPVRVLVVDDDATLRRSLQRLLMARGFHVTTAEGGAAGLAQLDVEEPDVVLADLRMPEMDGLTMLKRVKETHPNVTVIMMTAFADIDTAVAAVKAGAYHFLTKPFDSNESVALSIRKAADHRRLSNRAHELEERLKARERFGELVGTSPKMLDVYRLIDGVSMTTSTILILGESGTGKELVARAIHQRSPRANKPFVAVNCAAIPKDLVESELFGHVRGAFTGALTAREGLFEAADGGTILLDEVGDLTLAAQTSLLRTLQQGEIKRVGSNDTRVVDVRVLAATNVDLPGKIAAGTFRSDLFYRLNVIAVRVPPLRERGDDVLLLADYFLRKLARRMGRETKELGPDAERALLAYEWPGNVRELEHAMEHALVLSHGPAIHASDLPFAATPRAETDAPRPVSGVDAVEGFPSALLGLPYPYAKRQAMALFEEAYVSEALRRAAGNTSEAARLSGLDRSNFRRIARRSKEG